MLLINPEEGGDWENCSYTDATDAQVRKTAAVLETIPGASYPNPEERADRRATEQNSTISSYGKDRRMSVTKTGRYAINIPLCELKSFRKVVPKMGWTHLVFTMCDGVTLSPLYFHEGGTSAVRELIEYLSEFVYVSNEVGDPDLFLVNEDNKMQRSFQQLEISGPSSSFSRGSDGGLMYDMKEAIQWNIMEGFSKVTKAAKATARSAPFAKLFKGTTGASMDGEGYGSFGEDSETMSVELEESRPGAMYMNKQTLKHMMQKDEYSPAEEHVLDSEQETSTDLGTFEIVSTQKTIPVDSSSDKNIVMAKRKPLTREEFESFFDETGKLGKEKEFRERVFFGGIEPEIRKEAWKFLLHYYPYQSTFEEREKICKQREKEYFILKTQWQTVSAKQMSRFSKFKEAKHRIEKDVVRTDRVHAFYADGEDGSKNKNVVLLFEILFTYSFYNFDLGYVQGMSDLLSPILYILEGDEVESFWCFAEHMENMQNNFAEDQNGMHMHLNHLRDLIRVMDPSFHSYLEDRDCLNLFFCYRWLLINFKREFHFQDVIKLWEAILSEHLSIYFPIFFSLAILDSYKHSIVNKSMEFDDILKVGVLMCLRCVVTRQLTFSFLFWFLFKVH